jgi:hypothetical protein
VRRPGMSCSSVGSEHKEGRYGRPSGETKRGEGSAWEILGVSARSPGSDGGVLGSLCQNGVAIGVETAERGRGRGSTAANPHACEM